MFSSDRILAVDVGASKVVVAEFQVPRGGVPVLLRYGRRSLVTELSAEAHDPAVLGESIRDIMREQGMRPSPLYLAISGQAVFPRYVKLPPVAREKLLQIIGYEAEQNVPFPIEEVVWDYELLSEVSDDGASVMLMAVKTENVHQLTDGMDVARLEPEIVDAGPMALYNAYMYNYGAAEGCTMILDIGSKATGLLFIEPGRLFSRSVPVAGNAITQELARTLEIPFSEAESLKRAGGQVGLGGVTEIGQDDVAEQMAKVIRNVVTRLHAEINRSINFYRSQQGGRAPDRVLLTGGSSVLPNLPTFFEDKLGVPVEPLNPLANIVVSDSIAEERVLADLPLLAGPVGLALRRTGQCPIEINLMPPAIADAKAFRKRQPFFALAAVVVMAVLAGFWLYNVHDYRMKQRLLDDIGRQIRGLQSVKNDLDDAATTLRQRQDGADALTGLIDSRTEWIRVLDALHGALLDGMWLTTLTPTVDRDGLIHTIEIEGRGFEDKLKFFDRPPEATAIEVFRDRLRESPLFSPEGTDISKTPPSRYDFAREFGIRITLQEPIKVPQT